MPVQNQPRLNFTGIDVHSVHLDIENPYTDAEITNTIIPKLFLPKDTPDNFDIIMDISLESKGFFKINVSLSGKFILNLEAEDEHRNIFMHQNAPAILFPYVRSFISMLTSNLGSTCGTIIIPPQVFKGEIEVIDENEIS
jgi:preprotein translocase subunit SecB